MSRLLLKNLFAVALVGAFFFFPDFLLLVRDGIGALLSNAFSTR